MTVSKRAETCRLRPADRETGENTCGQPDTTRCRSYQKVAEEGHSNGACVGPDELEVTILWIGQTRSERFSRRSQAPGSHRKGGSHGWRSRGWSRCRLRLKKKLTQRWDNLQNETIAKGKRHKHTITQTGSRPALQLTQAAHREDPAGHPSEPSAAKIHIRDSAKMCYL